MAGGFAVWIVRPPGDEHWRGLLEAARGIVYALQRLGYGAKLIDNVVGPLPDTDSRLIVFNAHRLTASDGMGAVLPEDAIIFNAEQIPRPDAPIPLSWSLYLDRLRQHSVWDYSETNIERLRQMGCERVAFCRIGHYPGLESINKVTEDLDVLHFGSMNARRLKVVSQVGKLGLKVKMLHGVYGEERDKWIARAKIVLNVHFYSDPIFEIFRVSYLLANKKCVVTEDGGCDPFLEGFADIAAARVPYGDLAETCRQLIAEPMRRRVLSVHGNRLFTQIDQVEEVRLALESTRKLSVAV